MEPGPLLDLVHKAIRSGIFGHIQWKYSASLLVRNDPECHGLPPEIIRAMLRQFVVEGNQLEARVETRAEYLEEYPDCPFWFKAEISVPDRRRALFVEVVLVDDDPEEPWVEIASAHF